MKTLYLLLPLTILVSCGDKKVIEPAQPDPVKLLTLGEEAGGGVVVYLDDTRRNALVAAKTDIDDVKLPSVISHTSQLFASVEVSGLTGAFNSTLSFVMVDIEHPASGEITIQLVSPNNQTITLSANNGGSGANYSGTMFSNQFVYATAIKAGVPPFNQQPYYSPEQSFSQLSGTQVNGIWTLIVKDNKSGNNGKLIKWAPIFNGSRFLWHSNPGSPWQPVGATSKYLDLYYGSGKNNTESIVKQYGRVQQYAARLCDECTFGGYTDWYLPSRYDFDEMYKFKSLLNFDEHPYWTSSEGYYSTYSAVTKNMNTGQQSEEMKTVYRKVRPVRNFSR